MPYLTTTLLLLALAIWAPSGVHGETTASAPPPPPSDPRPSEGPKQQRSAIRIAPPPSDPRPSEVSEGQKKEQRRAAGRIAPQATKKAFEAAVPAVEAEPEHSSASKRVAVPSEGEGDTNTRVVDQTEDQPVSPTRPDRLHGRFEGQPFERRQAHPRKKSDEIVLMIKRSGLLSPAAQEMSLSELKEELNKHEFKVKLIGELFNRANSGQKSIKTGEDMLESAKELHSVFVSLYEKQMIEAMEDDARLREHLMQNSPGHRRPTMPHAQRVPYAEFAGFFPLAIMGGVTGFVASALIKRMLESNKQSKIESRGDEQQISFVGV